MQQKQQKQQYTISSEKKVVVKLSIKEKLEKILEKKVCSITELASELGVDKGQVSRWINGKSSPQVVNRIKIDKKYKEIF